jgi:hypothetical protein
MKRIVSLAFLLVMSITLMTTLSGCMDVDYGNRGVIVDKLGNDRGKFKMFDSGFVVYNPITEVAFQFPIFQQQETWTKSLTEGNTEDQSITFQSAESASCNVDIYITYYFDRSQLETIIRKYKMSADEIKKTYMRSMVRNAFNDVGGTMSTFNISGPMKSKLTADVKTTLNKELNPNGIYVTDISIIGKVHLDPSIQVSIDRAVAASQRAVEAQNDLKTVEARAQQVVVKAKADHDAILANPQYLEQLKIEAWAKSGCKVPLVMGSGINGFADMTKFLK